MWAWVGVSAKYLLGASNTPRPGRGEQKNGVPGPWQVPRRLRGLVRGPKYRRGTGANPAWVAAPGTASEGSITHQRHGTAPVPKGEKKKNETRSEVCSTARFPINQVKTPLFHVQCHVSPNPGPIPPPQLVPKEFPTPGRPGFFGTPPQLTLTDTPPPPPSPAARRFPCFPPPPLSIQQPNDSCLTSSTPPDHSPRPPTPPTSSVHQRFWAHSARRCPPRSTSPEPGFSRNSSSRYLYPCLNRNMPRWPGGPLSKPASSDTVCAGVSCCPPTTPDIHF